MDAITDDYGGDLQMIDVAPVRVHHSAATLKKSRGLMSWTKPECSDRENPCSDQQRRFTG